MITKKNISRDEIADTIHKEFGFSRKECLVLPFKTLAKALKS